MINDFHLFKSYRGKLSFLFYILLSLSFCFIFQILFLQCLAKDTVNSGMGEPLIDDLLDNGCVSSTSFWSDIKRELTNGNVDKAIDACRKVAARRELDPDMHCIYAMALEIKLHQSNMDSKVFDECVREWTKVAKTKNIFHGWQQMGEGEVFVANKERSALAKRHLIALVGTAPKKFEKEEEFLERVIKIQTDVSASIKQASKQLNKPKDKVY